MKSHIVLLFIDTYFSTHYDALNLCLHYLFSGLIWAEFLFKQDIGVFLLEAVTSIYIDMGYKKDYKL